MSAERTVVLGLMSYIDENGSHRVAYAGDTVKVHPDQLARFDRLNVLAGPAPEPQDTPKAETAAEPAPKSRPRTRKED